MKKVILLSLLVGALINTIGCATKVVGLKQSEDFKYNNILSGKMAVGGVTSAVDELKAREQMTFGNILKSQVIEEREKFNVQGSGFVKRKVGKKAYAQMLTELQDIGEVSKASMDLLSSKIKRPRFIIFSRIESNDIEKNRNEREQTDSKGNGTGSFTITSSATRSISASFYVVDLMKKQMAWNGIINKSGSSASNFNRKKESGLVSLIKAVKGTNEEQALDKKYPFPKAPSTKKVLARLFKGFAENLPEED